MRVLLDSHTLIWAADDPAKLSATALAAIQDPANNRLLSAGTIWEIGIKVGKARLPLTLPYRQWMEKAIADLKLDILPITVEYAERQAALPAHHNDPFDRLLIAQALVDGLPIVSADTVFESYGVKRMW
jgi:PIN domain nuclease of toxin-antitoxin system